MRTSSSSTAALRRSSPGDRPGPRTSSVGWAGSPAPTSLPWNLTRATCLGLDGKRASESVGEAALGADHVHHGVDQRQVREGLREVAEVATAARVDLFGIELQRARV